jgi:hypothetical protein
MHLESVRVHLRFALATAIMPLQVVMRHSQQFEGSRHRTLIAPTWWGPGSTGGADGDSAQGDDQAGRGNLFQLYPDGPEGRVDRIVPKKNTAVVFDGQSALHATTYVGERNASILSEQNWAKVRCDDGTARLIFSKATSGEHDDGGDGNPGGTWSVLNSAGEVLVSYPAARVLLKATWVADADDAAARARHAAADTKLLKNTK